MSVQSCLTGEITVSYAERRHGCIQCPGAGNEGMIDMYHLGNASQSRSLQAAFYELVNDLVTTPPPQTHKSYCEPWQIFQSQGDFRQDNFFLSLSVLSIYPL